jgi:hypothetical protein
MGVLRLQELDGATVYSVCGTADIGLGKGNNPSDVLQEKVNPG